MLLSEGGFVVAVVAVVAVVPGGCRWLVVVVRKNGKIRRPMWRDKPRTITTTFVTTIDYRAKRLTDTQELASHSRSFPFSLSLSLPHYSLLYSTTQHLPFSTYPVHRVTGQ